MNALAKSLAAPSGAAYPVGNPSAATLNLGLAAELVMRKETKSAMRATVLRHGIAKAYRFRFAPVDVTSVRQSARLAPCWLSQ